MDFSGMQILNPKMEYRRFGKTGKKISVITLGGMRYKHGWDEPRDVIPEDTIKECVETVELALKFGINHIETAYGYIKSEHLYGKVLNDLLKVKRDSYFLMTKGNPKTASETRELIEKQLKALKTDYFDFYAWHGINNFELVDIACKKNGPVEELLKLKDEGVIKHVGFSTHAPYDVIIRSIETDLFEFVNLHYYYFFQRNRGAIDLAESKDMGVFIISPNDKGGQLFSPSKKLRELTSPFHPLHWNARFCLSNPAIHTLSFGLPNLQQLDSILPSSVPLSGKDQEVKNKLDAQVLNDPVSAFEGYGMEKDPSGINIPEILRFRKLWKCYGMKKYGEYRYNMFQEKDHWFPGNFPTEENLKKVDTSNCPENIDVVGLIKETHNALFKPKKVQKTDIKVE